MMPEEHFIQDWETSELGKLEDAGQVVRGGGVDRYWIKEGVELNPEYYTGATKTFKFAWLYDPEKALAHFRLRSIEFGNWMNQQDRANFLYGAMLSLHHLALLLKVKDKQIGMGGKLSIALGARGHGRAAGHYEPSPFAVINITKTKGIGVLAHEFAHALDNIISFYTKSKQTYVSGGRTTRKGFDEEIRQKGNYFEQQFEEFFNILYYDTEGEKTPFHAALNKEDEYWNRRNEVFARTFEVSISEKLRKSSHTNHFLVSGAKGKAYPKPELVAQVSGIMDNIVLKGFELIGKNAPSLQGIVTGPVGYMGFRKTLKKNASLDDTLFHMKRIALRDYGQVADLARDLEGSSVAETAGNIWNWLRAHTRYKLDTEGIEELKTPARSLVDGRAGLRNPDFGIDCDDYTILISALLLNLGIEHEYRVVAYKRKGKFQHIYPVAFDTSGKAYIIDCVPEIPRFNYEAQPIIDLKTVTMDLHELSGIEETDEKQELLEELNEPFSLSGTDEEDPEDELLEASFLSGFAEVESEEEADIVLSGADDVVEMLERGILAEVNKARLSLLKEQGEPTILSQTIDVAKELELINRVMQSWGDEEEREQVIQEAISSGSSYSNFFKAIQLSLDKMQEEELQGIDDEEAEEPIYLARIDMSRYNLSDLPDDEDLEGLGKWRLKKFFKRIGKGIKKGFKKVVKAIVRYNPATIVMRTAIILTLKTNMFKIASRLIYGYLSEEQARAQGLDLNEWRKLVRSKNRSEKFFKKIGGRSKKFKKAIVKGRAAKKTGLRLSGLGIALTTSVAAAAGFIALAKKLLSSVDLNKLFKGKNKSSTEVTSEMPGPESPDNFSTDINTNTNKNTIMPDSPALNTDTQNKKGFFQKVRNFWLKHRKKVYVIGLGSVIVLVAFIIWNKRKKKKPLSGIKAARSRARRRKSPAQLKGSTTTLKAPAKSAGKARVSRRSNGSRLKAMHRKAKELQKKHPNSKYSTLLKRASKLI